MRTVAPLSSLSCLALANTARLTASEKQSKKSNGARCCSRWVCSPEPLPLSSRATWQSPISWRMRPEASFHCSMAASWPSSTASCSSISGSPAAANGASTDYERPRPPYRRAGPERGSAANRGRLWSAARPAITSGVRPKRRRGGLVRAFQLLHNMSLVLAIACVARTVQYGVGQIGLVGTSHIAFNERLPTKMGGRKP